jgi:hypothetical protein
MLTPIAVTGILFSFGIMRVSKNPNSPSASADTAHKTGEPVCRGVRQCLHEIVEIG